MPADKQPSAADDMKAKFKEALEKKHGNDSGAVDKSHAHGGKPPEPHGPEGGKRGFIRRKTG